MAPAFIAFVRSAHRNRAGMPSVIIQVLLLYGVSRLFGFVLQFLDRAEDRALERALDVTRTPPN